MVRACVARAARRAANDWACTPMPLTLPRPSAGSVPGPKFGAGPKRWFIDVSVRSIASAWSHRVSPRSSVRSDTHVPGPNRGKSACHCRMRLTPASTKAPVFDRTLLECHFSARERAPDERVSVRTTLNSKGCAKGAWRRTGEDGNVRVRPRVCGHSTLCPTPISSLGCQRSCSPSELPARTSSNT